MGSTYSCFTHGSGAVVSNSKEGQGGFQSSVLGTMLFDQPNTRFRLQVTLGVSVLNCVALTLPLKAGLSCQETRGQTQSQVKQRACQRCKELIRGELGVGWGEDREQGFGGL